MGSAWTRAVVISSIAPMTNVLGKTLLDELIPKPLKSNSTYVY